MLKGKFWQTDGTYLKANQNVFLHMLGNIAKVICFPFHIRFVL